MAKQRRRTAGNTRDRQTRSGQGRPIGGGRRKPCPFCRDKVDIVDYKDLASLRRAISDKGKIRSSRVTGACRRHQSQLATRRQARTRAGPAPVRRGPMSRTARATSSRTDHGSGDPSQGRGYARGARRRHRRLARLPAQLPRAAQARPAGHSRRDRRGRAPHAKPPSSAAVEAADKAEETAALLRKTVLTISHQAGDDGRLFGSVTSQEIVDAIRQARGLRLDKPRVRARGADQHHRHAHGHRRGRGRRDDRNQDHRHAPGVAVTLRRHSRAADGRRR